jgi:hypothetical protein
MSRYHAIHCQIWNDDKFPFVSDDCQLVFFHLLTTPMSTPFGCYKASMEALSAEKRWPVKRYLKAFREAFAKGFVKYDERHLVIFIPHFIDYNPPNNPNVLKAWGKVFSELPPSSLKDQCYQALALCMKGFGEAFQQAFREGFAKASPKVLVTDTDTAPVPDVVLGEKKSAERKGGRPSAASRRFPADFPRQPDEAFLTWAANECPDTDVRQQWPRMLDHEFEKPKTDWAAVSRNWMRNAPKFDAVPPTRNGSRTHLTTAEHNVQSAQAATRLVERMHRHATGRS